MKRGVIVASFFFFSVWIFMDLIPGRAWAEISAFEQMLSIFEQKGVLSPEEAGLLKKAYMSEQKALERKESALEEKERRLTQWENELTEKAEDLETPVAAGPVTPSPGPVAVETPAKTDKSPGLALKAEYNDGFGFRTEQGIPMSLYLKGLLQTDYRAYDYPGDDPAEDKFDIRRARLVLRGSLADLLEYCFQYEFEGAGSRRLLDAYADIDLADLSTLRLGQFKEPFGLEQTSSDQDLFFAERAMGYYLTPGRDVGASVYGNFWDDRIYCSLGLFNGDGKDDASGGDEDALEMTGRLAFSPFAGDGGKFNQSLQMGVSSSYAKIDRNNVRLDVKTTGLTSFLEVSSSAKFHVIQDARSRSRLGADLGFSLGPFAAWGEYTKIKFQDIEAGSSRFSFDAEDSYVSALYMVTGEKIGFAKGRILPVLPENPVDEGGAGAWGLAFRYDDFVADENVYEFLVEPGNSVRKAKAYSIALNWYLNRFARLTIDATRTDFDRPLLIYRDSRTGEAIYSRREDVITGRFQVGF